MLYSGVCLSTYAIEKPEGVHFAAVVVVPLLVCCTTALHLHGKKPQEVMQQVCKENVVQPCQAKQVRLMCTVN